VKSYHAVFFGPLLYAAGAATMRLCETRRLEAAVVTFALAVGMCSLLVLMLMEDD
jgi:hypothetical protein